MRQKHRNKVSEGSDDFDACMQNICIFSIRLNDTHRSEGKSIDNNSRGYVKQK